MDESGKDSLSKSFVRSIKDLPVAKEFAGKYIDRLITGAQTESAYENVYSFATASETESKEPVLFVRITDDISVASYDETGMRVAVDERLSLGASTAPDRSYYTNNGVVVVNENGKRFMSVASGNCIDQLESHGYNRKSQYVPNSFSNLTQVPAAVMNQYLPGYYADEYKKWLISTGEEIDDDLEDYVTQLRNAKFYREGVNLYIIWDEVGKTSPPPDIRSN